MHAENACTHVCNHGSFVATFYRAETPSSIPIKPRTDARTHARTHARTQAGTARLRLLVDAVLAPRCSKCLRFTFQRSDFGQSPNRVLITDRNGAFSDSEAPLGHTVTRHIVKSRWLPIYNYGLYSYGPLVAAVRRKVLFVAIFCPDQDIFVPWGFYNHKPVHRKFSDDSKRFFQSRVRP